MISGYIIPIPEEIILLITGYMASSRFIHLTPAIFVVIIAFIIGDNILFKLTVKNNKYIEKLIHEVLSIKIISKNKELFEKHIGIIIFLSRFIPFFRFIGPVFSGYIKAKEKTFMLFNTLAIVIYVPFIMWIGYFFNEYLNQIVVEVHKVKHILFVLVLIIIGLLISRAMNYFLNKTDLLK
ncbi:MAG: VTT domain-containing protein [bacterium]